MKTFAGFPAGRLRYTPLPDLFFSEILPAVDDLAELKVLLHCIWLIHRQRGALRYVTRSMLSADVCLHQGLASEDVLDQALARAVDRGILLAVEVSRDQGVEICYVVNTVEGRRAMGRLQRGAVEPKALATPAAGVPSPTRPNIFVLYEQNIGLLQPIIADDLRDAEQTYPMEWIEAAFRIAAERNVRHWRYVRAILQRWADQGKDDDDSAGSSGDDRRRYIQGPYAEYIEH